MRSIMICRDWTATPPGQYRAATADGEAVGPTVGQALDALVAQLGGQLGTAVIQVKEGDEFFSAEEQRRLAELKAKWRAALDAGRSLPPEERAELDNLIFAELSGTARRTAALFGAPAP